MENKNRNLWIGIGVAVLVVGFFVILSAKNNSATAPVVDNSSDTTVPDSTQDLSDNTGGSATVGAVSMSYADALVKYADRRIQLNKSCQAIPNTVTYKDNTGIMIDNRSAMTRTVKVGTTFTIKPYGFRIVVLPDVLLKSKTILVDCDQSQNVATILVQE